VIFLTERSEKSNYLSENPSSVVFLNIDSTMGGQALPWRNAGRKTGLKQTNNTLIPDTFKEPLLGDGKMEIIYYKSMGSVSGEILCGGKAKKVAQESGPFKLTFKSNPVQNLNSFKQLLLQRQVLASYLNVDGEYLRVTNPESIHIELAHQNNLTGKIKILRKMNKMKKLLKK
jgi:hypothetical protein